MNKAIMLASENIHTLHKWIQQVFTDRNGKGLDVMGELISSFDQEFTMVTQQGRVIGLPEVKQLFTSSLGKRPKLEIIIEDVVPIFDDNGIVTIRYCESHHECHLYKRRISTVIIDTSNEQLRWLYLHETPISER
ncbi:hypothetical protein SKA34_07853 [Photobacterium sp. SKA34]|uniref:hypothetical protein n=1 Tax=Photobacterium sp. SKA34 TaxID=121723 RepID=UPI00006B40CF|nr:hypothetical protein [Photobacterium sp. SKA34]EAR57483.1 hypothetical protein SKA34_07853 [Photobacterium sp. SKA34]